MECAVRKPQAPVLRIVRGIAPESDTGLAAASPPVRGGDLRLNLASLGRLVLREALRRADADRARRPAGAVRATRSAAYDPAAQVCRPALRIVEEGS